MSTRWKRPWCWDRLRAGGEGDDRGWDGWTASPSQWIWVSANSGSLLKLMSIESVMTSNNLILCRPLLLLPSIFPSIRVFSNESAPRIRWSKCWSFSFNIIPSNEHPGMIYNKHIAKYCLSGLLEFWCEEKIYCFRWDWLRCFQPPMLCRKYCFSDMEPCGFRSLDWILLEVSARWKRSPSCERGEKWSWGPPSRSRDPSMVRRW